MGRPQLPQRPGAEDLILALGRVVLSAALRPLLECTVALGTAAWSPGAPEPLQRWRLKFELGVVCETAVGFGRNSECAGHLLPSCCAILGASFACGRHSPRGSPSRNVGYTGLLPFSQL